MRRRHVCFCSRTQCACAWWNKTCAQVASPRPPHAHACSFVVSGYGARSTDCLQAILMFSRSHLSKKMRSEPANRRLRARLRASGTRVPAFKYTRFRRNVAHSCLVLYSESSRRRRAPLSSMVIVLVTTSSAMARKLAERFADTPAINLGSKCEGPAWTLIKIA